MDELMEMSDDSRELDTLEPPQTPETQQRKPEEDSVLASCIFRDEYELAKLNQSADNASFEATIDLLECNRSEKDYDWMSDVFIPDFPSIILTDASNFASQYFQSRDFVEVYLSSSDPQAKLKSQATKELVNNTLNRKELYHYQKYIRARLINSLGGFVWIKCQWEQQINPKIVGSEKVSVNLDVDQYGNPMVDPRVQRPATTMIDRAVMGEDIVFDRFNYEVFDPRNVFSSDEYAYTAQQKKWIIFRFESTYEDLVLDQKRCNYFNLDRVEEMKKPPETDTSKESYNKENKAQKPVSWYNLPLDCLERYGKQWVVVTERKEDGYPKTVVPGIDERGDKKPDAELLECIATVVYSGSSKVLIRLQPQPYRDGHGFAYRPLVRGICYIHPTKDTGLSDGKYGRELQVAINDTFNISNDRVKLATLPTLIGRKYAMQDNSTIYFAPEHVMEVDDPVSDLKEFQIRDNIQGALNQGATLTNKLQQVLSVYPTTMGDIPAIASTTATAIAGAESRANTRANYKSLTVEYTLLTDFYWMIMQMTYQFARKETAVKLMSANWKHFDPNADYTFMPLSQNIEQEYAKANKIKMWQQVLGMIASVPHPDTVKMINYIVSQIAQLMGKEFEEFSGMLLNPNVPSQNALPQNPQAGGMNPDAMSQQNGMTMGGNVPGAPGTDQNQYGGNMSAVEDAARSRAGYGGMQ